MAELSIVSATTPEGTTDDVLCIINSSTTNYRLAGVITMAGQYTFSVWVKAAAALSVEFRVLGNVYTESVTTAWKKVVFTVEESSTTYIDICPAADTALYLYKGMLQQGQFDTDWKPAPEDSTEEITSVKSLIQQTENSILQQVEGTYVTQDSFSTAKGSLELSISQKVGTDELVSQLNASADLINFVGDRFTVDSTNFKLLADGTVTMSNGRFGGWYFTGQKIFGGITAEGDMFGTAVMQAPSDDTTTVFAAGTHSEGTYEDCPFWVGKDGSTRAKSLTLDGIGMPQIQRGTVTVTVSAANTPTGKAITFPTAFAGTPHVFTQASTASPGVVILGTSMSGESTTGCTIYVTRNQSGSVGVRWQAVY